MNTPRTKPEIDRAIAALKQAQNEAGYAIRILTEQRGDAVDEALSTITDIENVCTAAKEYLR